MAFGSDGKSRQFGVGHVPYTNKELSTSLLILHPS